MQSQYYTWRTCFYFQRPTKNKVGSALSVLNLCLASSSSASSVPGWQSARNVSHVVSTTDMRRLSGTRRRHAQNWLTCRPSSSRDSDQTGIITSEFCDIYDTLFSCVLYFYYFVVWIYKVNIFDCHCVLHVGWLVALRIVALAVFQPYSDLEAGDNQSLKFKWRGGESNPRPLAPQAKSLTTRPPPLPLCYM